MQVKLLAPRRCLYNPPLLFVTGRDWQVEASRFAGREIHMQREWTHDRNVTREVAEPGVDAVDAIVTARTGIGAGQAVTGEWVLSRNCALAPAQLASCFVALAAVSVVIGFGFAIGGYWMVLPFAGIETLALGLAFLVYGRHASDHERIVAEGGRLLVETVCGSRVSRIEREASWVRVEYRGRRHDLIRLVTGGATIEVGRYVPGERRGLLAEELRSALSERRWRG